VRVAIGPRDLVSGTAEVARRDTKEKQIVQIADLETIIPALLDEIQDNMFQKALQFREENTRKVDTYDEFKRLLDDQPGFILAHYDGTPETEDRIKEDTKATIRCIPLNNPQEDGVCIVTGKPSTQRVVFARAY
jgi:prolyl-tRNA synthetase